MRYSKVEAFCEWSGRRTIELHIYIYGWWRNFVIYVWRNRIYLTKFLIRTTRGILNNWCPFSFTFCIRRLLLWLYLRFINFFTHFHSMFWTSTFYYTPFVVVLSYHSRELNCLAPMVIGSRDIYCVSFELKFVVLERVFFFILLRIILFFQFCWMICQ